MSDEKEQVENGEEFEAEQNVLGLFAILLAVDRRINPLSYQPPKVQKDD